MNASLRPIIEAQLDHTLFETDFRIGTKYRGKVRDVYTLEDRLLIVTTDRVSAFDHILGTIPFKGEILNSIAWAAFEATRDIAANHLISRPDPNATLVKKCTAYPVEFIVRGYITGSLWRDYARDGAPGYGLDFPKGLRKDQAFERPQLTPTTKAAIGDHDTPISKKEIIARGLMSEAQFENAERTALSLYARGAQLAADRGLILVDTKYEMGETPDGALTVIDEIHTPDSSRYWVAKEYDARFAEGVQQQMLDKENLRSWLLETHGFSGHGEPPALSDDIRIQLATRYAELHALLLGRAFVPTQGDVLERIRSNLHGEGLL